MGTTYKPGEIVVLSVDLLTRFGLFADILVFNVDYFLVCKVLYTEGFNSHYHAYIVNREPYPSFVFVKHSQLADHSVLGFYKSQYVSRKYHVM